MQQPNPYSPPSSPLEPASPLRTGKAAFPWLLVLRWVVGLAIALHGIYGLFVLAKSWSFMADRAIIDPGFSPYRYLPAALLKIGTGVAILLRSKWSVLLVVAWTAAFAYIFASVSSWRNLPPAFFFSLVEQFAVFSFLCLLWFRGRLR